MPVEPGANGREQSRAAGPDAPPDRAPGAVSAQLVDAARVADALGQGFAVIDARGRLLLINRSTRRVLGLSAERPAFADLLAACFPDPERLERSRQMLVRVARDRVPATIVTEAASGETRRRLIMQAGACRAAEAGLTLVAISLLDLEALSVAEDDARQGTRASRPSEGAAQNSPTEAVRRYREFFDASPNVNLTIGFDGRVSEVNRRVVQLLGFREDDVVGRHYGRFLDAQSRRRVRAALEAAPGQPAIENLELSIMGRDGEPREVVAIARAVEPARDGRWKGARVILRDVTRQNRLQRQLRQVDRLAATGRLAAGVAHEINNPLQALLMHLAVVERCLPEGFSQRDSWDRILEGVRRVKQIVADLLDLHRGPAADEAGADLNLVIEEALGLTRTQLRKTGIQVRCRLEPDLDVVACGGRHLYQIVLNLVLNAMAAMSEGGVLLVRTSLRAATGDVMLEIRDSGRGISEKIMPQLFEPFFSHGERRGTGLGLFVTFGLVRDCGGRIHVDSITGRGTTFRVLLPLERKLAS